jgi:hypothetical protein
MSWADRDAPQCMSDTESEMAAHLGDEAACLRLATDPGADYPDFASWAWGFSRFGHLNMVKVMAAAARVALPLARAYVAASEDETGLFASAHPADVLDAVDRDVAVSGTAWSAVSAVAEPFCTVVANLELYTEEAGGDSPVVDARERALSAVLAVRAAVEAALWNASAIGGEGMDPTEVAAQRDAGPALAVTTGLSRVCLATGLTRAELADALRRALVR